MDKKEKVKDSKEEFDAYEAAGIKRHVFKKAVKKYFSDTKEGLKTYKFHFAVAVLIVLIISGVATVSLLFMIMD